MLMGYGEGIGGRIRAEIDWIYDAACESGEDALQMEAIDALVGVLGKIASDADKIDEKLKKYRWHDLRKNPEDLQEDALSSVVAWDKNMKCCVFARYTGTEWVLRGNGGIYFPEVIAWRYIEPFEKVGE